MATMIFVDFHHYFIFILLCLFSILCYSLFFKKPKDSQSFDLPPSPPSLPIIGHLHLLLSRLIHKSLKKISSKYGPFLHLRVFNVSIVLISSASIAYEIFKSQDVNISTRNHPTNEGSLFLGSSSFINAPHGDYWKFMKKLIITNLLGPQALERSRGVRADEVKRFYSNLLDKAMKNESVEIVEEAMKLTNNTIFFRKPLKKIGISLFKKELTCISQKFDEVLEKILVDYDEKVDEHHQGTDMMDALLEAYGDENAEYKITRNHIKSLFVDLLIGGTDSLLFPKSGGGNVLSDYELPLPRLRAYTFKEINERKPRSRKRVVLPVEEEGEMGRPSLNLDVYDVDAVPAHSVSPTTVVDPALITSQIEKAKGKKLAVEGSRRGVDGDVVTRKVVQLKKGPNVLKKRSRDETAGCSGAAGKRARGEKRERGVDKATLVDAADEVGIAGVETVDEETVAEKTFETKGTLVVMPDSYDFDYRYR
ncbi:hypothetical protein AALP_AAs54448U000100 [Arabis alpina]|uniref:Cytochrome P450 n=1 Tax=Arabis alpina TaxID=50452 RepID=A0A087G0S2_ARAAL|nr:hypothetical protein AALP_AAs54448U000100 [Arabis alpina]